MDIAALVVAIAALFISGGSLWYARDQAQAARREDLRARHPHLEVTMRSTAQPHETRAFYTVTNHGPEDLDTVDVHRPQVRSRVQYPVAATTHGEPGDVAAIGPLAIGESADFALFIGGTQRPPSFRVRIDSRNGRASWKTTHELPDPRDLGVY